MAALRHQRDALGHDIGGGLPQKLLAVQRYGAATGLYQPDDGTQGSRLTGTIGAYQRDDGAVRHLQRDALNSFNAAIIYDQIFDFKHRFPPPDKRQ